MGGVFYGLGDPPGEDPRTATEANEETGETESGRQRTPLTMLIPTCVMVALGLATGIAAMIPRFAAAVEAAAVRFQDQSAYASLVLLALTALYWRRLSVLRSGYEPGRGRGSAIRSFESGIINDYITWLVTGVAALGGILDLIIR